MIKKSVYGFLLGLLIFSKNSTAETAAYVKNSKDASSPKSNPFDQGGKNVLPYFLDDDDDDDDEDDLFPAQLIKSALREKQAKQAEKKAPHHHKQEPAHKRKSKTPDPVYDGDAFKIGGALANGVISRAEQAPVVEINSETGVGSDELIADFNFPEADILDIAQVLAKLTKKNFIFDKDVGGKISIISNHPVTVADAWKAFLTALDVKNFAIIPSGAYLRIAKQREAREKQLPTYTGSDSPDSDALITRIFPLKYISATEVDRTFRGLLPSTARIIAYEQTNTIIVTDTGSNIQKLAKILDLLDIEGFDVGIEVIPVEFASAAELQKLIDQLIPGTAASPASSQRFTSSSAASKFNARKTKEGGVINTIIADDRTNTLILHANAKGASQVRELVKRLDQKPTNNSAGKVRVMYMQFADAEQVANTLNSIVQTSGAAKTPSSPSGGSATTGSNPTQSTIFEGNVKISPDKATNSLVITASASDFITVQKVIEGLDIPRAQVYIEVVIMELTVGKSFNWSNNVVSPRTPLSGIFTSNDDVQNAFNPQNLFGSAGAVIQFPLKIFGMEQDTTMTLPGSTSPVTLPSLLSLVTLLQQNNMGSVLATPQVVALDNQEAVFSSSENIPVPTITTSLNAGSQTSFTKEAVSISIKIKPQISKLADFIKLDIDTKYSDISSTQVPKSIRDSTFGTIERTATTAVVVGDGDTIVIGGLIRDKTQDTTKKVPLLGDIPILGWLFKSNQKTSEKTNLVIFMTPKINRQFEKTREILDDVLKQRHQFIERSGKDEDPQKEHRDRIIRSLPDEKTMQKRFESRELKGHQKQKEEILIPAQAVPAVQDVKPEGAQ